MPDRPSDELPARTPEAQTTELPDDTDVDSGRADLTDEPDHQSVMGALVDLAIGRVPDEGAEEDDAED